MYRHLPVGSIALWAHHIVTMEEPLGTRQYFLFESGGIGLAPCREFIPVPKGSTPDQLEALRSIIS